MFVVLVVVLVYLCKGPSNQLQDVQVKDKNGQVKIDPVKFEENAQNINSVDYTMAQIVNFKMQQ